MHKKWLKAACCALAFSCAFALCGCDEMLSLLFEESSTSSQTENSSSQTENSSSSSEESSGSVDDTGVPPTTEEPDAEKVLLRTEVDGIGHKVAYYSDGTHEDLGRVTPLSFVSPAPQTQYGYTQFSKMADGEGLCGFYQDLYDCAFAFHYSGKTLLPQTGIDDGKQYTYYEAGKVNFADHGLSREQALAVWSVFGEENPAFYWVDLMVLQDDYRVYLLVDETYVSAAVRATIDEKIKAMAYDCDSYLRGDTTLVERAVTIYDYLICKIEYAYEMDGVTPQDDAWAHNVTGGALYGKGVCETYAQTFDYFCGLFGIECMTVVGKAGTASDSLGGHAWNYLQLDGNWYAVDATWGDQKEYLLRSYFGRERAEFSKTHFPSLPTEAWGSNYQCALPTLSGELCPVRFGLEGGASQMVASMDEAFTKMTDEGGRYEITLYPHTLVTQRNGMIIYPTEGKIYSTNTLPKVEHVTFINGMKGYKASIGVHSKVTLQSNITMDGLTYESAQWDRNWKYFISKS